MYPKNYNNNYAPGFGSRAQWISIGSLYLSRSLSLSLSITYYIPVPDVGPKEGLAYLYHVGQIGWYR